MMGHNQKALNKKILLYYYNNFLQFLGDQVLICKCTLYRNIIQRAICTYTDIFNKSAAKNIVPCAFAF